MQRYQLQNGRTVVLNVYIRPRVRHPRRRRSLRLSPSLRLEYSSQEIRTGTAVPHPTSWGTRTGHTSSAISGGSSSASAPPDANDFTGDTKRRLWVGRRIGEDDDALSKPAVNMFGKLEDSTTARMSAASLFSRSNKRPYSSQNLIKHRRC